MLNYGQNIYGWEIETKALISSLRWPSPRSQFQVTFTPVTASSDLHPSHSSRWPSPQSQLHVTFTSFTASGDRHLSHSLKWPSPQPQSQMTFTKVTALHGVHQPVTSRDASRLYSTCICRPVGRTFSRQSHWHSAHWLLPHPAATWTASFLPLYSPGNASGK